MQKILNILILFSLLINSSAGNLFKYDQNTSPDILTTLQLIEESKEDQETKLLHKEYLTITFLTKGLVITSSFFAMGCYSGGCRSQVEIPPEPHLLPV